MTELEVIITLLEGAELMPSCKVWWIINAKVIGL